MIRLLPVIALAALLLASACRDEMKPPAEVRNHNSALVLLPGAYDEFTRIRDGGVEQQSYRLVAPYPAEAVIEEVSGRIEASGWRAQSGDFLNPGAEDSHASGWKDFIDSTTSPESEGQRWMADWRDRQGNLVRYVFEYRTFKGDKPDTSALRIHSLYIPSSVVELQVPSIENSPANGLK